MKRLAGFLSHAGTSCYVQVECGGPAWVQNPKLRKCYRYDGLEVDHHSLGWKDSVITYGTFSHLCSSQKPTATLLTLQDREEFMLVQSKLPFAL